MRDFSVETAGFAALTLVELLIQQCVIKGILNEEDVKGLLAAAARRHEAAASGSVDRIELNMETARLIHMLAEGLEPLFEQQIRTGQKAAAPPDSHEDGKG
jgi:hypothetical protein